MPMKWQDASEIVTGLILSNKVSEDAVDPGDLFPPYDEIVALKRKGWDTDKIVRRAGYSPVDTCLHSLDHINGSVTPLGWVNINKECASRTKGGSDLEKIAKDLKDGKDVDSAKILNVAANLDMGVREVTPMSEVDPTDAVWVKTGYEPLDRYVGGIPDACLTVVGASPGVGKTTFLLKLAKSMVRKYKRKYVLIFTLEMTMGQITFRILNIDTSVTKEERSRILLVDDTYNINEVYSIAAHTCAGNDVSMIGIDFADQLVEDEQTEAIMGKIYRMCSMLAKKTMTPVVLISQLNRETYRGGEPRVNHLRYSGMAEAMAALILLIHNPNNILAEFGAESSLARIEGRGYLIVGKSRFGFKEHSPGAILIEWDGLTGWGDKSFGYTKLVG